MAWHIFMASGRDFCGCSLPVAFPDPADKLFDRGVWQEALTSSLLPPAHIPFVRPAAEIAL